MPASPPGSLGEGPHRRKVPPAVMWLASSVPGCVQGTFPHPAAPPKRLQIKDHLALMALERPGREPTHPLLHPEPGQTAERSHEELSNVTLYGSSPPPSPGQRSGPSVCQTSMQCSVHLRVGDSLVFLVLTLKDVISPIYGSPVQW